MLSMKGRALHGGFFQIPNYSQKVHNGSKNASSYEAIFSYSGN